MSCSAIEQHQTITLTLIQATISSFQLQSRLITKQVPNNNLTSNHVMLTFRTLPMLITIRNPCF